ncbi:MAG TPA: TetR/AcrR family transcriptional regulator [Mycobacteriales bacterium]|jgi:AcrR family transcriptional regulator|nr:TetR/AcrR family transcriptional regulator [Mycobacteriales bacterium]
MATTRRLGAEDSTTRLALLDAARVLLLEEGYAAVTSRKVAARAGLKPQLVHYYFATMDDLFIALVRHGAELNLERQARALASPDPLRALWDFATDPAGATFTMELGALANHRKAIRAELSAYAERFRALQSEALREIFGPVETGVGELTPELLAFLMTALAQMLVMEDALGVGSGHKEARELIARLIERRGVS